MSADTVAPAHVGAALTYVPGKRLSLFDRRIWRDAALAWLAQHLFLLLPVYLTILFAPPRPITLQRLVLPWLSWDGWIYVNIAQHGYSALGQTAFFPLYPLAMRVVALGMGGHTALAGLLVANASGFLAYGILLLLVEREAGPVAARRTLLFLLCFPTSFFLVAAYTESLFLLLSAGAFFALRRHAWLAAGALAALATLTRPVGILLLLPLGAEALRGWWSEDRPAEDAPDETDSCSAGGARKRLAVSSVLRIEAGFVLPIAALAGYCGYLGARFGHPLGFLAAEGGMWGRRASWPWDSFVRSGVAVLRDPPNFALPAALDIILMALFIALVVLVARRLPLPYTLYAAASLVLIVMLPMHRENWGALSSNKRFMVDVFPLFMVLGMARPRRWIEPLTVLLALVLQILLTVVFLQRGWVA